MSNWYASVAVFNLTSDSRLAIATISITPGETVLSGAWVVDINRTEEITTVLAGKLAIPLNMKAEQAFSPNDYSYRKVSLSDFFAEAERDAKSSLDSFEEFKAEDIKKRKNLVRPDFFKWGEAPNLLNSWEILEQNGLPSRNDDCAPEMREVLGASRLVQYFIAQWHSDERARSGRRYLDGEDIEITILPKVWLN